MAKVMLFIAKVITEDNDIVIKVPAVIAIIIIMNAEDRVGRLYKWRLVYSPHIRANAGVRARNFPSTNKGTDKI